MATKRTFSALQAFFAPGQADGSITPDRVQDLIATAIVSDRVYVVRSLEDLPDPVGNEVMLPADKTVLLLENIDLGGDHLRLSAGTVLRGLAGASVTSLADGVVRADGLNAPVILRELNIIATGGAAIRASGGIDHQFNAFFVGLFGVKAAVIDGFDVASFKECFVQAADGLTFTGATNKTFISQCPIYGMSAANAAIEFDADYDGHRVDIIAPWFKDMAGAGIRALTGYNLQLGRVTNAMFLDVAQKLDGLNIDDLNWWFTNCDGLENSRAIADSRLESPATTAIFSENTWTPVSGGFSMSDDAERFEINVDNELVYVGRDPVRVLVTISVSCDPPQNTTWQFGLLKNGDIEDSSIVGIQQGTGAADQPRIVSVVNILRLNAGDVFKLAVSNNTNTSDLPVINVSYAVSD